MLFIDQLGMGFLKKQTVNYTGLVNDLFQLVKLSTEHQIIFIITVKL